MGHWDANRSSVIVGTSAAEIPQAFDALCWPYKAFVPEMVWA